jgi:hypothetical protein
MKRNILVLLISILWAGNLKAQIEKNENVGIGTEKPESKLHIKSSTVPIDIFPPNSFNDYFKTKDYDILYLERSGNNSIGPSVFLKGIHNQTSYSARLTLLSVTDAKANLAFLLSTNKGYKQQEIMRLTYDGKLGIGERNPKETLTVRGGGATLGIYDTNVLSKANNRFGRYPNSLVIQNDKNGTWKDNVVFHDSGNVGIGINHPTEKLHIKGEGSSEIRLESNLGSAYVRQSNGTLNFYNKGERLTILSNGNVGIGITSPDYKLDVKGTIRTQELKVDMEGADFVFENNYQLRSLEEVETFIKDNKHLPEIAPAKEMQENGVNQSEMNQKLLQKIEELTLYVIEQNKKTEALIEKNKLLEKEINLLKRNNHE